MTETETEKFPNRPKPMTAEQLAERRANGRPFSMIQQIAGATAAAEQQSVYLMAILDALVRIEGRLADMALTAAPDGADNNRSER